VKTGQIVAVILEGAAGTSQILVPSILIPTPFLPPSQAFSQAFSPPIGRAYQKSNMLPHRPIRCSNYWAIMPVIFYAREACLYTRKICRVLTAPSPPWALCSLLLFAWDVRINDTHAFFVFVRVVARSLNLQMGSRKRRTLERLNL